MSTGAGTSWAALAIAILIGGCVPTETAEVTDPPTISPGTTASPFGPAISGRCSAANAGRERPQQTELPEAVADMRDRLINAAADCDYALLEQMALDPDGVFRYGPTQSTAQYTAQSTGPGAPPDAGPGALWQAQEEGGERPLVALIEILTEEPQLQPETEPEGPGTGSDGPYYRWPPESDPHPQGYETGISSTGDWIFFVSP